MNRIALPAAIVGLGLLAAPASGQDDRDRRIDEIFAAFDGGMPGCAAGVVRNGRLVHSAGYGSGNLDYGIPLDGRSVFYLASVSKQFTAAAVALAAMDGHLSLDDDIRTYVPELPDYGERITVRHLVHHTSGLRDYLTLIPLSGRRADDHWTDEALLGLIARQRALNFAPGTEYLYSNTGYVLLAEIVKRATGRSLRQYADERIFRPLGMHDTHFHDDARQVVNRRVIGYARDGDGWRINHWFAFDKVGDGGLYSTVEDLARWVGNFENGTVGGQVLLERMHQRGVLAGGDTTPYAFGLNLARFRGLDIVEHGGSLAGFRTSIMRVPAERFAAIVLCNSPAVNPAQLTRHMAEVYLGDRMSSPPSPPSAATAAATQTVRSGADAAPAAVQDAEQFAGTWYSGELDATYRLEASDDALVLIRPDGGRIPLRIAAPDVFSAANGLRLRFRRGDGGGIDAFLVDAGRVRGIEFTRQPLR